MNEAISSCNANQFSTDFDNGFQLTFDQKFTRVIDSCRRIRCIACVFSAVFR